MDQLTLTANANTASASDLTPPHSPSAMSLQAVAGSPIECPPPTPPSSDTVLESDALPAQETTMPTKHWPMMNHVTQKLHSLRMQATHLAAAYRYSGVQYDHLSYRVRYHSQIHKNIRGFAVTNFTIEPAKQLPDMVYLFGTLEYALKDAEAALPYISWARWEDPFFRRVWCSLVSAESLLGEAAWKVESLRQALSIHETLATILRMERVVTKEGYSRGRQKVKVRNAWLSVLPRICWVL